MAVEGVTPSLTTLSISGASRDRTGDLWLAKRVSAGRIPPVWRGSGEISASLQYQSSGWHLVDGSEHREKHRDPCSVGSYATASARGGARGPNGVTLAARVGETEASPASLIPSSRGSASLFLGTVEIADVPKRPRRHSGP